MNKHERRLKGYHKFKKRLKNYRINPEVMLSTEAKSVNYALKTTGKPCSCFICSGQKYSRKTKHKNSTHGGR